MWLGAWDILIKRQMQKMLADTQLRPFNSSWAPYCAFEMAVKPWRFVEHRQSACLTQYVWFTRALNANWGRLQPLLWLSAARQWRSAALRPPLAIIVTLGSDAAYRWKPSVCKYRSTKCTGFHPSDHIHVSRSDSLTDDLVESLWRHTHTPQDT